MAEEDPIAPARVMRRGNNKVDSSNKTQDEQRESVERNNGQRIQSASRRRSNDSGSVTGILNENYYLHPFRHTRTSANKEVKYLVFLRLFCLYSQTNIVI